MIALEKKVGPEGPVIKGNAWLMGVDRVFELGGWTKEAKDLIGCLEVIVERLTVLLND